MSVQLDLIAFLNAPSSAYFCFFIIIFKHKFYDKLMSKPCPSSIRDSNSGPPEQQSFPITTSGQSYKASMLVNYDSRVASTNNLQVIMTLES